jgi:hypothetical protein
MKNLITKTFVFTYDRYDEITTSQYLEGIPHTVLCHTKEQKKQFITAGRIDKSAETVATGKPRGLSYNRNAALSMMKPGEWAMWWVDDLINVTYYKNYHRVVATNKGDSHRLPIEPVNQSKYREEFKTPCKPDMLYSIAEEAVRHAEQRGFALVGFSLTDNPMFRRNKYSYRGLADGRCWAVKKTDLRFDENVQLIDDTCWTAMNLRYFGGVVVNNWVLPNCKRYTAGAFGKKEDRMEQKIKECAYLVKTYPDHIKIASKAGWPQGSHVAIR